MCEWNHSLATTNTYGQTAWMWTDIVFSCECEAACGGEGAVRGWRLQVAWNEAAGTTLNCKRQIFSLNIAKIMLMIIKCSVSGVLFFFNIALLIVKHISAQNKKPKKKVLLVHTVNVVLWALLKLLVNVFGYAACMYILSLYYYNFHLQSLN